MSCRGCGIVKTSKSCRIKYELVNQKKRNGKKSLKNARKVEKITCLICGQQERKVVKTLKKRTVEVIQSDATRSRSFYSQFVNNVPRAKKQKVDVKALTLLESIENSKKKKKKKDLKTIFQKLNS